MGGGNTSITTTTTPTTTTTTTTTTTDQSSSRPVTRPKWPKNKRKFPQNIFPKTNKQTKAKRRPSSSSVPIDHSQKSSKNPKSKNQKTTRIVIYGGGLQPH